MSTGFMVGGDVYMNYILYLQIIICNLFYQTGKHYDIT